MNKFFALFCLLVAGLIALPGHAQFRIQKRKHLPGYHIDWGTRVNRPTVNREKELVKREPMHELNRLNETARSFPISSVPLVVGHPEPIVGKIFVEESKTKVTSIKRKRSVDQSFARKFFIPQGAGLRKAQLENLFQKKHETEVQRDGKGRNTIAVLSFVLMVLGAIPLIVGPAGKVFSDATLVFLALCFGLGFIFSIIGLGARKNKGFAIIAFLASLTLIGLTIYALSNLSISLY